MYFVTRLLRLNYLFTLPLSLATNVIIIQLANALGLEYLTFLIQIFTGISLFYILLELNNSRIRNLTLFYSTYLLFVIILNSRSFRNLPNLHPDIHENLSYLRLYEENNHLTNYVEGYFNLANFFGFGTQSNQFYFYWGGVFGAISISYAQSVISKLYNQSILVIFVVINFIWPFNFIYKWVGGTWSFSIFLITFFFILFLLKVDYIQKVTTYFTICFTFFGLGLISPSISPQMTITLFLAGLILKSWRIIFLSIAVSVMSLSLFFNPLRILRSALQQTNSSISLNLINPVNILSPTYIPEFDAIANESLLLRSLINFIYPTRMDSILEDRIDLIVIYSIFLLILIYVITKVRKSFEPELKILLVFFCFYFLTGSMEFSYFHGRTGIVVILTLSLLFSQYLYKWFNRNRFLFALLFVVVLVFTNFKIPTYFTYKNEEMFQAIVYKIANENVKSISINQWYEEISGLDGVESTIFSIDEQVSSCTNNEDVSFINLLKKPTNSLLDGSFVFNIYNFDVSRNYVSRDFKNLNKLLFSSKNTANFQTFLTIQC